MFGIQFVSSEWIKENHLSVVKGDIMLPKIFYRLIVIPFDLHIQ